MKAKRSLVAALLAGVMLVLAACGTATGSNTGNNAGSSNDDGTFSRVELSPDNPVEITVFITSSQMAPDANNKISDLLRDELGVTLRYEVVNEDLIDQRLGTMITSGDFAELLGTTDLNGRLIEAGALLRLDDYLDSGEWPNLLTHVEPYRARLTWTGDGAEEGLYIFPNFNRIYGSNPDPSYWGTAFWIQKAVLEYLDYPDLENMTLDRYFDMIEEYMAANPTINGVPTIGFSFPMGGGQEWGLTNPPMFLAGYPNNGGVIVDENNVADIYANSDYARDYFRFLNEANARGLLDPESFTQTQDQYLAKVSSGVVLGMHNQRWAFGTAHDALVSNGQLERTYAATMPVFEGREPYYADRDVLNINQGFGVSVTAENPELVLTFLDTILTEEWQKILNWGIEGEDYLVDEDGIFYRTPEMRLEQTDLAWMSRNRLMAFVDNMPKLQGFYSDGNAFSAGTQPGEFFASLEEYDQNFLEAYGKETWRQFLNDAPENPVYYPAWQIALPDGSPAALANTQMADLSLSVLPQIILGSPDNFDAAWQAYLDQFDQINVEAYLEVINAGIQDRIANWSN